MAWAWPGDRQRFRILMALRTDVSSTGSGWATIPGAISDIQLRG
jgi:hypothetical protein